ncbi:MAG: hypothetical protein Q8O95_02060 [bacterium]|nr:hypothetical protein [bacterium]
MDIISQINERGVLTLPLKVRKQFPGLQVVHIRVVNNAIMLQPLEIKKDVTLELNNRSQEAYEKGTLTLNEVDKIMTRHQTLEKQINDGIDEMLEAGEDQQMIAESGFSPRIGNELL